MNWDQLDALIAAQMTNCRVGNWDADVVNAWETGMTMLRDAILAVVPPEQTHAEIRAKVDAWLEAQKKEWDWETYDDDEFVEWNAYKLGAIDYAFAVAVVPPEPAEIVIEVSDEVFDALDSPEQRVWKLLESRIGPRAVVPEPPVPAQRINAIIQEAKSLAELFECKTPGNGGPVPGHCAACCGGTMIEASSQDEFDFAVALSKLVSAGEKYARAAAPEPPTPPDGEWISRGHLQRALLNDYAERPGISEKTVARIRALIDAQPLSTELTEHRATCFVDDICFVCGTTRLEDCEGHAP